MQVQYQVLMWDMVAVFYRAKLTFENLRENYERAVQEYSHKMSVDRAQLHLGTHQMAQLLDFKAIEELRDHLLWDLKTFSHRMFRTSNSTDIFDKYVSDIYHEVSILKEEHYTVSIYAPAYEEGVQQDLTERDKILAEVHEFFPRKLEQIHNLFQKAQARLWEILPQFTQDKVFVRSLYLFGEETLTGACEGGLDGFYMKMYPSGQAVDGYVGAARSFLESGFGDHARQALDRAKAALKKSVLPEKVKKEKRDELRALSRAMPVQAPQS